MVEAITLRARCLLPPMLSSGKFLLFLQKKKEKKEKEKEKYILLTVLQCCGVFLSWK
jgi:hypothetical protein